MTKAKDECLWCGDTMFRLNTKTMKVEDCQHCLVIEKEHEGIKINNLSKTARPLAFTPSTEKELLAKNIQYKRIRNGKTAKDHAGGSKARNEARKQARADWQKDNRATAATFPE